VEKYRAYDKTEDFVEEEQFPQYRRLRAINWSAYRVRFFSAGEEFVTST
jgi:hypothetical protein